MTLFAKFVELARMRVGNTGNIAGIFNDRDLHTEADSEIRYSVFACVFCRQYHTVDTSAAEAAGHDYTIKVCELFVDVCFIEHLGVDPMNTYMRVQRISCVAHCLGNRKVCVVKLNVFSD